MTDTTRMYPPKLIEFARRLYADGRTTREIRDAIHKRGYYPKLDTVRYWVDEEYREEKLRLQRKFNPPGPARRKGWQRRLARMRDLREAGVTYAAIAKVMNLDFGLSLNRDQAECIVKGKVKDIQHFLHPEAIQ